MKEEGAMFVGGDGCLRLAISLCVSECVRVCVCVFVYL